MKGTKSNETFYPVAHRELNISDGTYGNTINFSRTYRMCFLSMFYLSYMGQNLDTYRSVKYFIRHVCKVFH
jgi:hypothetical protein